MVVCIEFASQIMQSCGGGGGGAWLPHSQAFGGGDWSSLQLPILQLLKGGEISRAAIAALFESMGMDASMIKQQASEQNQPTDRPSRKI